MLMLFFRQQVAIRQLGRIIFFFQRVTPCDLDTPRIARGVRGLQKKPAC
jgi:hypothetical protein